MVGHINKPHGTKGEVFVWPLTDHPEDVFAPGVVVLSARPESSEPDPNGAPLRVSQVRPFRRGLLVRFSGVDDREGAETLRDVYLLRPIEDLAPLQEGEVFYHQLLGMTVEAKTGERIGKIVEVFEVRPADLLPVRTATGSVLIPFTREVVVSVDPEQKVMTVDPPEGLLDL